MVIRSVRGLVLLHEFAPRFTNHVNRTVCFTAADVASENVFLELNTATDLLPLARHFLISILYPFYVDHI